MPLCFYLLAVRTEAAEVSGGSSHYFNNIIFFTLEVLPVLSE